MDIGGSNIRAGIVDLRQDKAPDLSKARVSSSELWRHADDEPSRDEAIKRLGSMLKAQLKQAKKDGLAVATPACTLAALPRLEIAAAVQRGWGEEGATTIAPALKLNLRSFEEVPVGVAVAANAVWNPADGQIKSFALNVPVSHRIKEKLVVHANLGWIGQTGSGDRHALFWSAQAELTVARELALMGEVFGSDRGAPGGQAGLRWVTDRGGSTWICWPATASTELRATR